MQQTVLSILALILPFLGVFLPGILKQDKLTPQTNSAIAFAVVVIVSAAQAWAAGKIGVNPYLDFAAVLGGISALLAGPFKSLDQYMQSNVGFGAKSGTTPPTQPAEPTPIILPSSAQQSTTDVTQKPGN